MGRTKGNDGLGELLVILGFAVVAVALYYDRAGRGQENDAALIPNNIEGRIDFLVGKLNEQFGKRWVDEGFDALRAYLERAYPSLAALVGAVYTVEQIARGQFIRVSGYAKQQAAVQRAFAR
ncbi:MAG: hypothetical protein LC803_21165 [Acidobacteria bacterium]|nr:hypothetical protein [Acidobacteriota bacterium]